MNFKELHFISEIAIVNNSNCDKILLQNIMPNKKVQINQPV